MKKIVTIGSPLPEIETFDLDSKYALSDADIIIFRPDVENSYAFFKDEKGHKGKTLISKRSSASFLEQIRYWKKEIENFLNLGKTLFVFLVEPQEIYYYTGQQRITGVGRNQKSTDYVDVVDNYSFFPFNHLKVQPIEGVSIFPSSIIVNSFYESFKSSIAPVAHIEFPFDSDVVFTTKSKDRKLGLILMKEYKGKVVFLPYVDIEDEQYFDFNEDNWNQEGIRLGKKLVQAILDIDSRLTQIKPKTISPDWAHLGQYQIQSAEALKKKVAENEKSISNLILHTNNLKKEISDIEEVKDLLYESGERLENAVIKALNLLGFKAENYDDGYLEIDQIIISPEGDRYIGECEGKENKDIDITKFRQLIDSLNEDYAKETTMDRATGILFGNPQRLVEIEKRSLDFTDKCKRGAQREKVALIKTSDLFFIIQYLLENNDEKYKTACRNAIKEQLGQIVIFPDRPDFSLI